MVGTKAGGMKAAKTNKRLYGEDFYARLGRKGGQNGHTGGFAANPMLARSAGAKGGKISRRGPSSNVLDKNAKRIGELIDSGVSYSDIAKLYGVSYHSMRYWVNKERENE